MALDPFTIASIASMGIGTLGSVFGGSNDADQYIQKALEQYEGLVPPDLAEAIVYTQFQQGGQLTPEQLSALPIEAQKAVQIVESPEMRQKQEVQRQALEQLSRTGMGPQELLALEKVRRTTASDAQSRFQSLMGKYEQMGQAGGGASLAAALQSNQAADDRAAMEAMQAASMAAENRRSAIKQAYDAASGMRATDLDVTKANAENERQKQMFDIQNAINRQKINAENRAAAQRFNVARQQEVSDKNIAQQNAEALRRGHTAKQAMYENQLNLAKAKAEAYSGRAGIEQQRGQARAQSWMDLGKGGAQIFGSLAKSGKSKNSGFDFDEDGMQVDSFNNSSYGKA
jgi:hypothetical protein